MDIPYSFEGNSALLIQDRVPRELHDYPFIARNQPINGYYRVNLPNMPKYVVELYFALAYKIYTGPTEFPNSLCSQLVSLDYLLLQKNLLPWSFLNPYLLRYAKENISDKFYWIYLQEYPSLYGQAVEDEYRRMHGDTQIPVYNIFQTGLSYEPIQSLPRQPNVGIPGFLFNGYINETPTTREYHHHGGGYGVVQTGNAEQWQRDSIQYAEDGNDEFINTRQHLLTSLSLDVLQNTLVSRSIENTMSGQQSINFLLQLASIPGVAVCGGLINALVNPRNFRTNLDTDIFIYGDVDIVQTTQNIIKLITDMFGSVGVSHNNNVIQLKSYSHFNDSFTHLNEIQIIKRKYQNFNEIMLGFDLDSSAVGMTVLNGVLSIYAPQRYLTAVKYGINVINPNRQSQSYNHRLSKYANRGFIPFCPIDKPEYYQQINQIIINHVYYHNSTVFIPSIVNIYKYMYQSAEIPTMSDYMSWKSEYIQQTPVSQVQHNIIGRRRVQPENMLKQLGYIRNQRYVDQSRDLAIINIVKEQGSAYNGGNNVSLELLFQILYYVGAYENWKTQQPGTQITNTFNPTHVDYLNLAVYVEYYNLIIQALNTRVSQTMEVGRTSQRKRRSDDDDDDNQGKRMR